jgi:2'-phosphotransferase
MPLKLVAQIVSSNTPAFKLAHNTPLPMNQDQSTVLEVSGKSTSNSNTNPNGDLLKPPRKHRPGKGKEKEKFDEAKSSPNQRDQPPKQNQSGAKLRGQAHDSPDVRISKTLSWLLRHGAQGEGLKMRTDGYVKVDDLVRCPTFLHAEPCGLSHSC